MDAAEGNVGNVSRFDALLHDQNTDQFSGLVWCYLDVDGVLNSEQSAGALHYDHFVLGKPLDQRIFGFNPVETNNLRRLIESLPNLRFIISSTWRKGRTVEQLQELFNENGLDGSLVQGKTGNSPTGNRGWEIQQHLIANPHIVDFVILDDDSDMGDLLPYLIKTDFRVGLTLIHNEQIIKRLKKR